MFEQRIYMEEGDDWPFAFRTSETFDFSLALKKKCWNLDQVLKMKVFLFHWVKRSTAASTCLSSLTNIISDFHISYSLFT